MTWRLSRGVDSDTWWMFGRTSYRRHYKIDKYRLCTPEWVEKGRIAGTYSGTPIARIFEIMVPSLGAQADTAPHCVLVVEDDVSIRLVLAEAMRDAALCVIEARTGEDAVNYLNTGGQVSLVFSDIQMPGPIDGLQLARRLRASHPAVPVILTSGNIRPAELANTEKFIPKPYDIGRVVALVTQILEENAT
jgi:CheY-like chemotaxis protein